MKAVDTVNTVVVVDDVDTRDIVETVETVYTLDTGKPVIIRQFQGYHLNSILCNLLDVIIITKEEAHLSTSNLQFGFKQGTSTSMCTEMVQNNISYCVHNGSNVYGLMPDVSKSFDLINY